MVMVATVMAEVMVMDMAVTAIPVLAFISAHRFTRILTTVTLIRTSTPIIIRPPWSPSRQHRLYTSRDLGHPSNNIHPDTGITVTIPKAIIPI